MDIFSSVIVRLYNAKPFQSDLLDSLAETMNVTGLLKKGKMQRYYKVPFLKAGAVSYFNFVLFGANYYDKLSSEEKRAVGAHEFNHILENHGMQKINRQILPSLVFGFLVGLLFFAADSSFNFLPFAQTGKILVAASIMAVFFSVSLFCSFYINSNWLHHQETQSDLKATKFVNGEALISALNKLNFTHPPRLNCLSLRLLPKTHPPLEERITTIRKAMKQTIPSEYPI